MTVQSIASQGRRQVSQARKLIKGAVPSPMSMEQTFEMWSEHDVIVDGDASYVRSKFSAHRYFMVVGTACTCERENCSHIQKAAAARSRS